MTESNQTFWEQSITQFYDTWRYLPDMRTKQPEKPQLLTIDDLDISKLEKSKRKRKKRKTATKKGSAKGKKSSSNKTKKKAV